MEVALRSNFCSLKANSYCKLGHDRIENKDTVVPEQGLGRETHSWNVQSRYGRGVSNTNARCNRHSMATFVAPLRSAPGHLWNIAGIGNHVLAFHIAGELREILRRAILHIWVGGQGHSHLGAEWF